MAHRSLRANQTATKYDDIPAGRRPTTTRNEGFDRDELLQSLSSDNPLRTNINYTSEQLFFLEYVLKYGLNAGLTRIYNETIEGMAKFYTDAIGAGKIPSKSSTGEVKVEVKYLAEGKPVYTDISTHWPHEFIKNKSVSQTIVFRHHITSNDVVDIITVPFMYGCRWCITANKSPFELHKGGENALNYRGFFIIEGTPRFIVAHEKIAHNAITTVYSETDKRYDTSLKTQDEKNNSVEYKLYKGIKQRKSTKKEEENTYFLSSGCFNKSIEVNKIFKQIYILLQKLRDSEDGQGLPPVRDYDGYMQNLVHTVAGTHLQHFVLYEWTQDSDIPLEPLGKFNNLKEALNALYKCNPNSKNSRADNYMALNTDLTTINNYAEMVIRSIFPSISFSNTGPNRLRNKYDMYQSKAMLLMRMVVANILTEQKVFNPTDRNNVGNKAYLTAAEIFRRDLTRDEGSILREESLKGDWKPKNIVVRGESNVMEVIDFSNPFDFFSSMTMFTIPRDVNSKDLTIRGVNDSHTGYICPYDTPSNAMVGLTTHSTMTCCFSIPKNVSIIYRLINKILKDRHIEEHFPSNDTGLRLLSVNSVPHALVDRETFITIKNRFKRDHLFMDMVVIEEAYTIHANMDPNGQQRTEISSYNILCDSARIYRPLYNVEELIKKDLLDDDKINNYFTGTLSNGKRIPKTLEEVVKDGIIEMVFPSELEYKLIATGRKQITESRNKNEGDNKYNYCEIDPLSLFGLTASCGPMINHSPGNRGMHEPAMAKSAITPISTNIEQLSEASAKVLHSAQAAPVTTRTNEIVSSYVANGVCAIMAIAIREENLEDAYAASEAWARNITTERIVTIEVTLEKDDIQGIPEGNDYKMKRYHNMDRNTGLPKVGEYRAIGDAIFAKYRIEEVPSTSQDQSKETQIVNKTEFIEIGKGGYVQKIKKVKLEKSIVYRITVSTIKNVQTGDKLATRYSQKGVVGGIKAAKDMPRIISGKRKGLIPDLIFSPMSLTSRATPAVIHELLLGNYAIATGKQVDASAFSMTLERLSQYNNELINLGYEPWGIETYEHPETKQRFQMMTGIAYVRVLKHTAFEKQKACGFVNFSSMDKIMRQPSKGGPTGAIRGGYMDWDTFASHSAAHMISTMWRDQSDRVLIEICSTCGHLCDRCNRNPETVKDIHAATHCTKCNHTTLVTTKVPWCLVDIYFQLLNVGVKLSLFPGME